MTEWLKRNIACYVRNAATIRDYRVQLRGNRALLLWGLYLFVLIGFTMIVYSGSTRASEISIVEAQRELRNFYQAVMILLSVMVTLVAPALAAGSIVMERQRHSLDLVFSAPVSTKYYLVGKMLSGYRYIWMLLILALPVTSACVVLGGATWSDVVAAYLILSLNALIYTSMALLISTLSRQPVAAVVWSYFAAITYSIITALLAGQAVFMSVAGMARGQDAPFIVTLNPFFTVQASPTFSMVYGYEVPNWVLGALFALFFCKVMLLTAGSVLSGFGSAETRSLRVHGLIGTFVFTALATYSLTGSMTLSRVVTAGSSRTFSMSGWEPGLDLTFGWVLTPILIAIPFLSCYGSDGERRYWSDGIFRPQNAFLGTPSGGLPYVMMVIAAAYAGSGFVNLQMGFSYPSPAILFWTLAFWTLMWSIGRLASSFNQGLKSARALQFTIMIGIIALPVPFLTASGAFSSTSPGMWDLYILRPLIGTEDNRTLALVYGGIMLFSTLVLTYVAETNAVRKGVIHRYAS